MTNTQILLALLLTAFAGIVIIIFRKRRWIGAIGWTLVAIAFIVSALNINDVSFLSSTVRIGIAIVGMAMATYDYVRYERPRRRQRRQTTSLLEGPPAIRRRHRFSIRGRRSARPERKERP